MSLYIEIETVTDVLLADGWHKVEGKTFYIDNYDFHSGDKTMEISTRGFAFDEVGGSLIMGPVESILAVKVEEPPDA